MSKKTAAATSRFIRAGMALALGAVVAGLSGCASTTFKGTPFYTGEYEKRTGPAEDRVNLWPLLYYRNPALSVLWPIFEHTDEHAAVRPLFSVYRLNEPRKEYNVLWPLAQFDRKHADNRIFPVYWGDDYAAVFPLYWHTDDPYDSAGRGLDTLFPLYIYNNAGKADYSLHLLWPFFNRKHDGATQGWRLWPAYARWRTSRVDYYGWYAWPLGWRWGDTDSHSRLLLPLFYQNSAPRQSTFASLLTGWRRDPDHAWGYLLPVGFYRQDRDESAGWYTLLGGRRTEPDGDGFWYAVPALAWGHREGNRSDLWAGGPLFHSRREPESSSSHLLPLYYSSRARDESMFVSLPYSRHRDKNGAWNLVPPVWFDYEDESLDFTLTPLFMRGTDKRTGEPWTAVPPVYYHRNAEEGDTFLSPLYSAWTGANRSRHTLIPPALSYYRNAGERRDLWTLGGLAHWSRGESRGSSYLFPLYYESGDGETILSPLWATWKPAAGTGRSITAVPPLLSWLDSDRDSRSLHLLLAAGKFSWGEKPEQSWLFPFYYFNPSDRDFLSLPYARWHEGDLTGTAVPLLLSSYVRDGDDRDLRLLLGLYGRSWSTRPDSVSSSWLFPVYASGRDHFLTLPAGRWKSEGTAFTYFPTPLVGWRTGATRGSWLFPLYLYSRDVATDVRQLYFFPWGGYRAQDEHSESALFPFYRYENDGVIVASQTPEELARTRGRYWHVLYLAAYENRRQPLTEWDRENKASRLVAATYHAENRLFPLWHYERNVRSDTGRLEKEFTLLWFLQDYWRKADSGPEAREDYTRTRILWRFLHYERDHDTVSLDVFPAITYDRDGAEKRKVSFLWRAFRYERKNGQKAVDLLFVPVWRTGWAP